LLVEDHLPLRRGDGRALAEGEHELLAQVEAPPLLGISFLRGLGEEREGVAEVLEPLRVVVLDVDLNEPAHARHRLQADVDTLGVLVPGVLNQLEQGECLAALLQQLSEPRLIDLEPVAHVVSPEP
jgi:hypothetical protein